MIQLCGSGDEPREEDHQEHDTEYGFSSPSTALLSSALYSSAKGMGSRFALNVGDGARTVNIVQARAQEDEGCLTHSVVLGSGFVLAS